MIQWLFTLIWLSIHLGRGFSGVEDFFIEASVNNTTPYIGEQITYTVRYYALSQDGIRVQYPDFEGFWIGESYESYSGLQVINDKQFFVREVQINLAPLTAEEIIIAPARLLIGGDVFRSEQILDSQAITLTTQSLPDGAPASFNGAVGDFVMSADFEAGIIILGDPFVFGITIQGVGILDSLNPPTLNLSTNWRVFSQSPQYMRGNQTIGVALGNKQFRWVIIPNEAGSHLISPIEWTYFDPRTQTYITLAIPSFTLDVLPSLDGETRLSSAQTAPLTLLPLKASALNYEFYDHLTNFQWGLCWGVMPLIFLMTILNSKYQHRKIRQATHKRYKTAFNRAKKRLNLLRNKPNLVKMSGVVIAYIADKSNTSNADVTEDIGTYIQHQETKIMVENLMTMIKSMAYAPKNTDYDAIALIDKIEIVLSELEKGWGK